MTSLQRIRWGVRGVLGLGVAASVIANVLHAVDNPISQSIAAWPPLALLLTVELISRIPVHSRALAVARVVATAAIAGIAAWVSYWHMVGVAARYGETGASPYLLPISVDGLIVVASICLVELAGRIRAAEGVGTVDTPAVATTDPTPEPAPEPVRPKRVKARSLTAAERVIAAHDKQPEATHARIAQLAEVSLSTAKRHRPTGSPSAPSPAPTLINGNVPDLEDVKP